MADAIAAAIVTEETGAENPAVAAAAAASAPVVPDKFKNADGSVNTESLLASYVELEKKQGTPKADDKAAPATEQKVDETKPEEKKVEEPKSDVEQNVSEVLKANGLDLGEFNTEYAKDGTLSEDSYKKLAEKGFSKATVDQFIAGQVAASASLITEVKAIAGGDEAYGQMVEWAKASMKPEEIAEFNEAVSSGKPGIIKAAVQMMKSKYAASEGIDPSLINAGGKPSGEVFSSWNEVEAAMNDKRYGKDPAYTKMIEQKAIRSDVRKR
jgi:hypothetical protein